MDPFTAARDVFLEKLKPAERALLQARTNPQDILAELQAAEDQHRDESVTRKLLQKIDPFLQGIEQYGKAFDILSIVKPEILSLLWGGALLLLHLVREFLDLFEKLIEMLRQLGKRLGMFEIYARFYPSSTRLKESLFDAYVAFLEFCKKTRTILNEAKPKKSQRIGSGSAKLGLKMVWKPAKVYFAATTEKWEKATDDVMKEADIAEKEKASIARKKADARDQSARAWYWGMNTEVNSFQRLALKEESGCLASCKASTIITHFVKQFEATDIIVTYYYCDYKNPETQQPRKVLETLLADLCRQNSSILDLVEVFSKKYQKFKTSCTLKVLGKVLIESLELSRQTVIVIDALDECLDRVGLLQELLHILDAGPALNLFITSRKEFDISLCLENVPQLSLSIPDVSLDIDRYVRNQLDQVIHLRRLKIRDPTLQVEICDTLSSKADGMFQWVKCQLDALCRAISDKAIRKALANVPIELDETYIRVFARLKYEFPEEIEAIQRIFYWLVHGVRRLKVAEISEAVVFRTGQDTMDASAVPTEPEDLLQYCGGLASISETDHTTGLAHFSIKEFLLSDRIQGSECSEFFAGKESVKLEIADTCISYLAMKDFSNGQCRTMRNLTLRLEKYCFLQYASLYWLDHYKYLAEGSAELIDEKIFQVFTASSTQKNVLAWKQVEKRERDWRYKGIPSRDQWEREEQPKVNEVVRQSPVYHTAFYGLWEVTRRLLDAGYDANTPGGDFGFPIHAAAWGGIAIWDFVPKFIKAGANPNTESKYGTIALANAIKGSPHDWWLLKDLVIAGIDINSRSEGCHSRATTILEAISQHASDAAEMAEFLISQGAGVNGLDFFTEKSKRLASLGPPLQQSCYRGTMKVAEVLLNHGARMNFADCWLGTPLQAAIRGNNENLVHVLISNGASILAEGGEFGSPLQAAAWVGNTKLVEFCLETGADVNQVGGLYGTALTAAVYQKHTETVDLLLQHNANANGGLPESLEYVDRRGSQGQIARFSNRPINWAIDFRDYSLVLRLINLGVDLNKPDGRCNSGSGSSRDSHHPLCSAINTQNEAIITLLLSKGARASHGNYCASVSAARLETPDVFEKLLADIVIDQDKVTVFAEAFALCSSSDTLNFLIDTMPRRSIQFSRDTSGLLLSGSIANSEKVGYLLSIGADPRGKYNPERIGETWVESDPALLSSAIAKRSFKSVDLLLRHGADIDAGRRTYGTPLCAAMKIKDFSLAKKLLDCGAKPKQDIWIRNSCWKLLHLTAANKDLSLLELFLEKGADLQERCDFCPSAIWSAIMNENSQLIHFLVEKGADINECDIYGRTLLYRAERIHLEDACATLSKLGARREISESIRKQCIENTVHRLSRQLMPQSGPEDVENSAMWPKWLSYYRWIFLGRSLCLGNDNGNAIIALEQSLIKKASTEGDRSYSSGVHCAICKWNWQGKYHLCKDSEKMGICHDSCLQKHEAQLKEDEIFESHEYLTYPRDFLSEIPEGQVAHSENEFVPLTTWLEGLASWKVRWSNDPHTEGDRQSSSIK